MLEIAFKGFEISNFLRERASGGGETSERQLGLLESDWVNWKQTKSVIRECHQSRGNHNIEWEGVKILDQQMVDIKRKIKDAIDIRWQRPTLNRDGGYEFLAIFNHLL